MIQIATIHFFRPAYKDDQFCDDDNNFEGCSFDGGACCGDDVKKNYCTECKCLDPNPFTSIPIYLHKL